MCTGPNRLNLKARLDRTEFYTALVFYNVWSRRKKNDWHRHKKSVAVEFTRN